VFGDHVQFSDGEAVISGGGTCFVPDESYVVAHMWLEINTAASDLENVTSVVLRNCVVTIRATQATLNVGLVCIDACRGSLCKPQRDQQGRYNDQQEYSLHGILRRFLALRRSEISLGI
jgi:hypothetical protein